MSLMLATVYCLLCRSEMECSSQPNTPIRSDDELSFGSAADVVDAGGDDRSSFFWLDELETDAAAPSLLEWLEQDIMHESVAGGAGAHQFNCLEDMETDMTPPCSPCMAPAPAILPVGKQKAKAKAKIPKKRLMVPGPAKRTKDDHDRVCSRMREAKATFRYAASKNLKHGAVVDYADKVNRESICRPSFSLVAQPARSGGGLVVKSRKDGSSRGLRVFSWRGMLDVAYNKLANQSFLAHIYRCSKQTIQRIRMVVAEVYFALQCW